jgi:hypothetical protein
MEKEIKEIKNILERSDKLEFEEAIRPPFMEIRLKEKSIHFTSSGQGRIEEISYSGKTFEEAYRALSEAVVQGEGIFKRNITEPYLSYLIRACSEYLKLFTK